MTGVVALAGGSARALPERELAALLRAHDEVLVDLGTGDGRFVLRAARARPRALVVGVDPVRSAMAASASRAVRKPVRGGVPNALFLVAAVERLPAGLAGAASEVTVLFPWGSLLRAVGQPDPRLMPAIVGLLRPGGRLTALLNASAAERATHAERLALPPLDDVAVERRLLPGWHAAGMSAVRARLLDAGEVPLQRTTWGQRLIRGSARQTLAITGLRAPEGAPGGGS